MVEGEGTGKEEKGPQGGNSEFRGGRRRLSGHAFSLNMLVKNLIKNYEGS